MIIDHHHSKLFRSYDPFRIEKRATISNQFIVCQWKISELSVIYAKNLYDLRRKSRLQKLIDIKQV